MQLNFNVLVYVLAFVGCCRAQRRPSDDEYCPLCDYVYTDDGFFQYTLINSYDRSVDLGVDVTTYYINMTSQKWLDETWATDAVWYHSMYIHVPNSIDYQQDAFLYISGGSESEGPPGLPDLLHHEHGDFTALYAASARMVTAVLYHIPNQPITYTEDPDQKGRYEDDSIAWTWRYYGDAWLRDDGDTDPRVVLRMPMCKGTIKAMDTVELFVNNDLGVANIERFMLSGQSKRGWTTWLASPIDQRVIAMAPTVLSSLNMTLISHHTYQSFGGWPYYYWDYWNKGLMGRLDNNETQALWELVDPYSYRQWMNFPKLVVSAASDEFFLPTDTHYWWDDLPGEMYFWMMDNVGHDLTPSPAYPDYWKVMETFHKDTINNVTRPILSWLRDAPSDRDGQGSITLFTDQEPSYISSFSAMSVVPERRDWRRLILCRPEELCGEKETNITWIEDSVDQLGAGEYEARYDAPEDGFLAFYIYMEFPASNGEKYIFTTEVNVVPDYFPFEDCSGQECQGILK